MNQMWKTRERWGEVYPQVDLLNGGWKVPKPLPRLLCTVEEPEADRDQAES